MRTPKTRSKTPPTISNVIHGSRLGSPPALAPARDLFLVGVVRASATHLRMALEPIRFRPRKFAPLHRYRQGWLTLLLRKPCPGLSPAAIAVPKGIQLADGEPGEITRVTDHARPPSPIR